MWGPPLFGLMASSTIREGLAGPCLSLISVLAKPAGWGLIQQWFMDSRSGGWKPEAGCEVWVWRGLWSCLLAVPMGIASVLSWVLPPPLMRTATKLDQDPLK